MQIKNFLADEEEMPVPPTDDDDSSANQDKIDRESAVQDIVDYFARKANGKSKEQVENTADPVWMENDEVDDDGILEEQVANTSPNLVKQDEVEDVLVPHFELPPTYNTTLGKEFTDKWCVLEPGVNDWFPANSKDKWMLRAPYFILPGAKKSGTTSLAYFLSQHPLIQKARTKELQFFLNKNFRIPFVNEDRKTLVKEARTAMYQTEYTSSVLQKNENLISMDATPGYLFFSAMLPQRVLCVCPWIKMVVILRDPIDRAFSNHAFVQFRQNRKFNFERWIRQDMNMLTKSGFLNATNPQEEEDSWERYLGLASEGPIGRSLYEIQLRQWFKAFESIGRDPKTQIYIVRSEDMKKDMQGEMKKIHTFLGLPFVEVKSEEKRVVSTYDAPMQNATRKMLQNFFAPYNRKLYELLGGDWNGQKQWPDKI